MRFVLLLDKLGQNFKKAAFQRAYELLANSNRNRLRPMWNADRHADLQKYVDESDYTHCSGCRDRVVPKQDVVCARCARLELSRY